MPQFKPGHRPITQPNAAHILPGARHGRVNGQLIAREKRGVKCTGAIGGRLAFDFSLGADDGRRPHIKKGIADGPQPTGIPFFRCATGIEEGQTQVAQSILEFRKHQVTIDVDIIAFIVVIVISMIIIFVVCGPEPQGWLPMGKAAMTDKVKYVRPIISEERIDQVLPTGADHEFPVNHDFMGYHGVYDLRHFIFGGNGGIIWL